MRTTDFPEHKAFQWFIEKMGMDQWAKRRARVIDYLVSLDAYTYGSEETIASERIFKPIAIYDDWMAWYLFLVETAFTGPWSGDHVQLARIKPFFAAIGRGLQYLEQMKGIEDRMLTMLNKKRNQPDAGLFELVVALGYQKNGWKVSFLAEEKSKRMPDLLAEKEGKSLYVECKRLAKVNDYAEAERQSWTKRWLEMHSVIASTGLPVAITVRFNVSIEQVKENAMAEAFGSYMKNPPSMWGEERGFDGFRLAVSLIDLKSVNASLNEKPARYASPALIQALLGSYDPHGNYTCLLIPGELVHFGNTTIEVVLSKSISNLRFAAVGCWESLADEAIANKAKDIKKLLSKAISQIPDGEIGAIHLGYETVLGPEVEQKRHAKIEETVYTFDYSHKRLAAVYSHAIQPLATIKGYECAETTSFFIKDPSYRLEETLLLDPPGLHIRNTTHWEEDLQAKRAR